MEDLLRKMRSLRVYDRQADLWPSPFLRWDPEHFLAQATWEWPPKRKPTTAQVLYDGMKLAAAEYARMMRSAEWTEPILDNL